MGRSSPEPLRRPRLLRAKTSSGVAEALGARNRRQAITLSGHLRRDRSGHDPIAARDPSVANREARPGGRLRDGFRSGGDADEHRAGPLHLPHGPRVRRFAVQRSR
jgi:hypothetical protein